MHPSKRIRVFTHKYPLIGPTFWTVSIQYFVTELFVAWTWAMPYSFSKNTISDLGNTVCGLYSDRFVCSPYYTWMNVSFMVLGITMMVGSILIYEEFQKSIFNRVGFTFMGLAGAGTVLVGLFPENTIGTFHYLGALLPFLLGNIALIIFGFSLGLSGKFQMYTVLSGVLSLVALVLFTTHNYLGLGIGGMERLVAHPQTLWLISFGIYMSRNRFGKTASKTVAKL